MGPVVRTRLVSRISAPTEAPKEEMLALSVVQAFTGTEQEGSWLPWCFAPQKPKPRPEKTLLFVQRPGIRSDGYA